MKEKTLKRGIEILKTLENAREIKRNIEEKRNLCFGNTSEVAGRKFLLNIADGNGATYIYISSKAAYEALNIDLENAKKVTTAIEKELELLQEVE